MGKKRKYQKQQAGGPYGMGYGEMPSQTAGPQYGEGGGYGAYGGYGGYGGGPQPQPQQGFDGMHGGAYHHHGHGYGYGYGGNGAFGGGFPGAGLFDAGLLQNMPAFLRSGNAEQFLLGAVLGATAAWVLADEELRGKLIKAGMKLYAGVAGGFEEMKEQMADIKAEVAAERHGED
ncbi:hypothetical protein ACE0DR_06700 [Azotobacter sp. CWF10]